MQSSRSKYVSIFLAHAPENNIQRCEYDMYIEYCDAIVSNYKSKAPYEDVCSFVAQHLDDELTPMQMANKFYEEYIYLTE